ERELDDDRARLEAEVPFEAFASGVAEKLASAAPRRPRARAWLWRLAPVAAAACVLVGLALQRRASDDDGVRSKGGAAAVLFVKDARGLRAWLPGESISEQADVHAELRG